MIRQGLYKMDKKYKTGKSGKIILDKGDVTKKDIRTENDFVSHMVEHIAWRLGCSISLDWKGQDWKALGLALGKEISRFERKEERSTALGMIDDGCALITLDFSGKGVQIEGVDSVDIDDLLSQRVEQMKRGKDLALIIEGISEAIGAKISVLVTYDIDMHHTWEAIFRGIGIALKYIYFPEDQKEWKMPSYKITNPLVPGMNLSVQEASFNYAKVSRGTSETGVAVEIDFSSKDIDLQFQMGGGYEDVEFRGFKELLSSLAREAGFGLRVRFESKKLSSTHVLLEDTGLVLGRALIEVMKIRMKETGVEGAGSNASQGIDQDVIAGLSVEGRSFLVFAPLEKKVRISKLIRGNTIIDTFSEDLDDFFYGLVQGMGSSLIINLRSSEASAWKDIFSSVGKALEEAFRSNPSRKGVPPGVKATLV